MSNQKEHQSVRPPIKPVRSMGGGGMHGAMGAPAERPKNFKKTLRQLVAYLHPFRFRLLIVLLFAAASTVFTIVSPKVLGMAITRLFEGLMMKMSGNPTASIDFPYIIRILFILAALYTAASVFNFIMQFLMAGVAQKTVYNLRQDVKRKLTRLPLKYFDMHSHGDILSRITNDIDLISTTLQQSLTQVITSFVTIIGVIIMMLTISPVLTLVTVIILPLSFFVVRKIIKKSQEYFAQQQKILGELNGHIEEMFTGHREVKAFNHEEESISIFEKKNEQLYEAGWKARFISSIIMPLMMAINSLGYVIISVAGAIFVTRQMITIGDVQAFIQYSRSFTQPIQQMANIANLLQSTIAAAERVFEILEENEEIQDPQQPAVFTHAGGTVELKHVSFRYREDTPLIEDLNIHVAPGSSIAIVGPTGAGKTTLVNLLMRFYEINSGTILIDGIDIRQIRRGDLRNAFGMVLQDSWLFKGSIRENIAYGREGATEEEIHEVAQAAHADHFIRTLPNGYDTVLNEEASNISAGQKQLITIARAFLAAPEILILDEATSNVDTRTELIIQKAMAALMKGRTNFIIAHRLSTIREADTILVMNEGSIVEQGNHESLLAANGFYADLYNSQFAGEAI